MRRRAFLVTAAVATAGCAGNSGNGNGNDESTASSPTPDPTATDRPTATPTQTEQPLVEGPAEELLLKIDQLPAGWERTDESLDEPPIARLFKRGTGDGLFTYAAAYDDEETAAEEYESGVADATEGRSTQEPDVKGADEAVLFEDDEGDVWVVFRARNARGAVRRYASVISYEDVVEFAELQLEHY